MVVTNHWYALGSTGHGVLRKVSIFRCRGRFPSGDICTISFYNTQSKTTKAKNKMQTAMYTPEELSGFKESRDTCNKLRKEHDKEIKSEESKFQTQETMMK